MISFEAGLFGIGGLLIMGPRMGGAVEHHGIMLGAAAGILFGVSDTAIKALTGIVGAHGVARRAAEPLAGGRVLASIVAFFASARGLQDGEAVPVIAVTGTAANIAGIAGGIVVFGDPMAGSAVGVLLQALAFVLVIVAAALMPAPVRSAGIAPQPAAARPAAWPRGAASIPRDANHLPARAQGARDPQEEDRHPRPEVRQGPQEEGGRAAATWGVHARVHHHSEEA